VAESFTVITKEITQRLGAILGTRVYVGIYSENGQILHQDDDIKQFENFVSNFIKSNFQYLTVGDHSLPLSGHNIVFFKFENAMLVLYTKKGKLGQLLAFKSQMSKYYERVNSAVSQTSGEVIEKEEISVIKEAALTPENILVREERIGIIPEIRKKLTGKERLEMSEATVIRKLDSKKSLIELYQEEGPDFIDENLYKLIQNKLVVIPTHELVQIKCPVCKALHYEYVPKFCLEASPEGKIRKLIINPGVCAHPFLLYIDKKLKVKTQEIKKKISDIEHKMDLSSVSIEKLIGFLGQDVFNNIFHSVFFRRKVVIIEDEPLLISKHVFGLLSRIFGNIHYNEHVVSMTREEFKKNKRMYTNFLVVDAAYNCIINELYSGEEELLEFETNLFKKIIKEPDEHRQFLQTYDAFTRIFLLTEKIIDEIKIYTIKQISEEDLIERIKKNHDIDLKLEDIPLIKKLSLIYYAFNKCCLTHFISIPFLPNFSRTNIFFRECFFSKKLPDLC